MSRAYIDLGLPAFTVPLLIAWVAAMTYALPGLRRLARRGRYRAATLVAWVGFAWMGWSFLFAWIAPVLGAVSSLASGLPADLGVAASAVGSFEAAALAAAVVAVYGHLDAWRLRVARVRLASPRAGASRRPFRLVLISDVHLGTLVGARALRRLVDRIREFDADVVVSVSDLVDGGEHRRAGFRVLRSEAVDVAGVVSLAGGWTIRRVGPIPTSASRSGG